MSTLSDMSDCFQYLYVVAYMYIPIVFLVGPLPISLSRSCLSDIAENDYWVCEKSDGERCMLYIQDQYNVFLIDRKWNIKKIKNEQILPNVLNKFPSLFGNINIIVHDLDNAKCDCCICNIGMYVLRLVCVNVICISL